jgi:uncharacterized delta-60 repeat protein
MKPRTKLFRPGLEMLEDRAVPAAGSLDPMFGHLGLVTRTDETFVESPNSARAIQIDGKIVVAGESQKYEDGSFIGAPQDFAIARYNLDGTLDTSFAGKGWINIDFGSSRDVATAVVVQPDGRIVVAGYSNMNAADAMQDKGYEFALLRLNSDGTLDKSFDGDGMRTIDFGPDFEDKAQALALRLDGKILVSGNRFSEFYGYGFEVARLNPDGSLDPSFSENGIQFVDFGTIYDFNSDLTLQPDGKIVLSGTQDSGWFNSGEYSPNYDFAMARLNADGTFDTTFDDDGRLSIDLASDFDYGAAVAVQPDGKIVVGGTSFQGTGYEFAAARLHADGSLDASFDGDGWQTIDLGGWEELINYGIQDEEARDLVLQPDGRIILAGSAIHEETNSDFAVARLNADGSLDSSFNGDGRQTIVSGSTEVCQGVALHSDGRIVVAGIAREVGFGGDVFRDVSLARLNSDGSLDPTFGDGGSLRSDFPRRPRPIALTAVATQEDGKIVATGGNVVVRFNPDGTLDATFGKDGIVTGSFFQTVKVQQDGKLVLSGGSTVTRLNADGSVDLTFGNGGRVTFDVGVSALALTADGRIAVAGSFGEVRINPDGTPEVVGGFFQVLMLNPDGSSDCSFDGDGKQLIHFAPASAVHALAMAIGPNGEIAVGGTWENRGPDGREVSYAVACLQNDGRPDTSFGEAGKQRIRLEGRIVGQNNHDDFDQVPDVADLAYLPNGKLVVAGTSSDLNRPGSTGDDFTVFRLTRDGRLDRSFGDNGWLALDLGNTAGGPVNSEAVSAMVLQPDGKIVLAGTAFVGDAEDFTLVRLTKDGHLDTTFDGDGKQIIDFGLGRDVAADVALQRDGMIVVVGKAGDLERSSHFALAQIMGKGKKSPTLSINDVERLEGQSGMTPFTFTVRLSQRSKETVTVKYRAVSGSTTFDSVRPDYQFTSGTLTFAPGETTKEITIMVYADRDGEVNGKNLDEAFETFAVLLSQPTNASLDNDRGLGTIVDDDVRISISDATITDGLDGQSTFITFTISFSAAFDHAVDIGYYTQDFTALAGEDYLEQSGIVTFEAGETSKAITIEVIGDLAPEDDEEFFIDLFADDSVFWSIIKSRGVGTILNDD